MLSCSRDIAAAVATAVSPAGARVGLREVRWVWVWAPGVLALVVRWVHARMHGCADGAMARCAAHSYALFAPCPIFQRELSCTGGACAHSIMAVRSVLGNRRGPNRGVDASSG